MVASLCANVKPILTSIGLLLDIAGAWLVAIEVVARFKGSQYERLPIPYGGNASPPKETAEFTAWNKRRLRIMGLGLGLLTVGFLLQLVSSWL